MAAIWVLKLKTCDELKILTLDPFGIEGMTAHVASILVLSSSLYGIDMKWIRFNILPAGQMIRWDWDEIEIYEMVIQ